MEDITMRINFNRLSVLAGLPASGRSSRRLNENKDMYSEMDNMENEPMDEMEDPMDEMEDPMDEMEDPMDEIIEVDETELVQELRRAKRIMQENKRRKAASAARQQRRKQRLYEAHLKELIDEEVQNVMAEMNLTGGWVYGERKPRRSRNGYTHQGSYFPGVGFRR